MSWGLLAVLVCCAVFVPATIGAFFSIYVMDWLMLRGENKRDK